MDDIAHSYVKLVLALGKHDSSYVDAYYGPAEWNSEPEQPLESLVSVASDLYESLVNFTPQPSEESLEFLRLTFLTKQALSVKTYANNLFKKIFLPFEEEAALLYDSKSPRTSDEVFAKIIASLDNELPLAGQGKSLQERYSLWMHQFLIPPERVNDVFQCAIQEAKRQTKRWIALPEGENFVVEYVTGKPWSGYNWYKGNFFSVIQVNMDLPIHIDRAIDLAAHEGFPGHHVFNSLLEEKLYKNLGWVEFCVYPLFSPQSLIAEGTANFGIEMIFPTIDERVAFEEKHLFPLAGIDPSLARKFYQIQAAMKGLSYLSNEGCRRLLDGEYTAEQTVKYLSDSGMSSVESARKRIDFFTTYRSYIINYNVGLDLVRRYVEVHTQVQPGEDPSKEGELRRRWKLFELLLTTPRVPSLLE